jgi:hypothetical protein
MSPPLHCVQGRLTDTNANLVARALLVAAELAKAMGPAWDRSARDFCRAALDCLGDKKKQVGLQDVLWNMGDKKKGALL